MCAIGGVAVYFSEPVRDDYSGLHVEEPGCVNLDGQQALAFVRARHLEYQDEDSGRWRTDPSGDLGRMTRQQEFIRKAITKAVSKGLTNPATLNDLVGVGVDHVGLDPSLDAGSDQFCPGIADDRGACIGKKGGGLTRVDLGDV